MTRFFNTTGPCDPSQHYMLPPLLRLPELRRLVDEQRFYGLHAARQSGKTTIVRALAEELRAEGIVALHVSLESSRQTPRLLDAEPRWLWELRNTASLYLAPQDRPPPPDEATGPPGTRLSQTIQRWAARLHPRRLVLFLDEVDVLEGEALVSFLAQLRTGFDHRPQGFASSIGLIGLRDPSIGVSRGIGGVARRTFNVRSHSLSLQAFSEIEVAELFQQHTEETSQAFTAEAVRVAGELTGGHPFLVNSLGYYLTREAPVPLSRAIDVGDVMLARDRLSLARSGYLEDLSRLLQDRRGARVQPWRAPDGLVPEGDEAMDDDSTASMLEC